jgi:hypothetical protein
MRLPVATLLLAAGAFPAIADSAAVRHAAIDALVPPERQTEWAPGIPGGVPQRSAICAHIKASEFGDGAVDASGRIQGALDSCSLGQVVQLSAGEFKIDNTLFVRRAVVLRGRGPERTLLKMRVGIVKPVILLGVQWPKFTQSVDLVADGVKGSRSVAVADVSSLAPGELVAIDSITDPAITEWSKNSPPGSKSRAWFTRPDRPLGQVLEVASTSGNRVTFTTPLHIAFRTAFKAQLSRFSNAEGGPVVPAVKYAGIEDLHVYGGGNANIRISLAGYSWVKNVESEYHSDESIAIEFAFRCVVRDSYIHDTQHPEPGGGGYGLAISFYSADNLVENNISWRFNKVMVMRASGGGNVIAYNYMDDGYISYSLSWVEVGLNASHMTTPHSELFEGNESFNFDGDNTWGNSVYITAFRNHLTGLRRSIGGPPLQDLMNRRAVGLMEGHRWYTFVGNVLGFPGMTPAPAASFVYETAFPWSADPVGMWRLGYNPEKWSARADPRVLATVIRDGNFDYVTNQVHWRKGRKHIPDSLYLTSKPAFFGDNPWPWVDPVGAVKLHVLPARARFDAMNPGGTASSAKPQTR